MPLLLVKRYRSAFKPREGPGARVCMVSQVLYDGQKPSGPVISMNKEWNLIFAIEAGLFVVSLGSNFYARMR